MSTGDSYDAIVIGAGPNGLAAAIRVARAGRSVLVLEGRVTIGGGCRTAALTLPGFLHDVCSAVHPLAAASPFLSSLPLADHGLDLIDPPAALAHPLDDGTAVVLERSVAHTADGLGGDRHAYRRLMEPYVSRWNELVEQVMSPLRFPTHPLLLARFGVKAVMPAGRLSRNAFDGERARALFAGLSAHSVLPLEHPFTSAFGLVLGAAGHAVGWPVARGGSQTIVEAMATHLRQLGGEIRTEQPVSSIDELPAGRALLFDLTPRQLTRVAAERLPASYLRRLGKWRHGPGVFKLDLALDGPIPWRAQECARAGTIHVGGTFEEIAASESAVGRGEHPERPFVLLAQQSLFDETRAPPGKHTAWAYCHVPNGSAVDMSERILHQVARFAPGFRDRIMAMAAMGPSDLEGYDPNYIGGDISGGTHGGLQLFARPTLSLTPYATPADGVFICSSSTPPGAGVHGMCGFHAATAALRWLDHRADR